MALECVEGADVAGMSDERGRRACGAARRAFTLRWT